MKFILLLCLLLVAFGFRHQNHFKSQYDLGYEAAIRDVASELDLDQDEGCYIHEIILGTC